MKDSIGIAWDDLQVLSVAASASSLSEVARRLKVSVPTVGRRLDRLEALLDRRLFHRHPGGLTPTPEAAELLERAGEVADRVDDFLRVAARLDTDEATVTVSTLEIVIEHILAPELPAFRSAHPGIDLVFRADPRIVRLDRRVADVAVRVVRPHEPRVVGKRVGTVPFALYAARSYLEEAPIGSVDDLSGRPVVMYAEPWDRTPEMSWLAERMYGTRPVVRVSTAASMAAVIRSGAAIGVLPTFLGEGLVEIVEPEGVQPRHIWVVLHEDLRRAPHVRAVADFLSDTIGAALQ
ncbi:MAG: LysR family transcriptional regulator [Deltaproteobacteria bacterium]|nr:LysR family transcriptional regulator [Deltaproteobacteria bacterium]